MLSGGANVNQLSRTMPGEGPMDLSQRIIENYQTKCSQAVRPDYLEYLTQKALRYADQTEPKPVAVDFDGACAALVERIFALLEPYTVELNRVNRLKQLHMTAVSPTRTNEVLEYDRNRRPLKTISFFRARFSTSCLSLVVRGLRNRVEFFILPADRVIGLAAIEAETSPLMVFEADPEVQSNAAIAWSVEGKSLSLDRIERYSLLALEYLLDRSQEELVSLAKQQSSNYLL